ncbi:hypothetical protein HL657_09000 [Methanoculleus sp. YWC-01]|uniref:Translation elongation factor n=1 Tax=Methanoculleus nereidis TaxID=2735141 RepID=A0ABU3Z3A1_9EURY|nr:hypothetical protein [Methanoculleus sp. YWC-01]MDV4343297.1 hypothetical protein [Methanoculleus sp. YWC-01]
MGKNDDAWQNVFNNLNLLEKINNNGFVYVTADELKENSGNHREPRLMAKQDTLNSRPTIFRKHNLSIFPVDNGRYIIFKDDTQQSYYSYSASLDSTLITEYIPRADIQNFKTLRLSTVTSESQAIDYAYLISLLRTFTNESDLFLTIRGRLRSTKFDFSLPDCDHRVNVSGVQIEVDAGFESRDRIYVLEAKIGKRDDFHIRQLYYPYRDWSIRTDKEVVPIFVIYTNGIFYLTEFKFGDRFGELEVVRSQGFVVNEPVRQSINLGELIKTVPVVSEEPQGVPYPQANDLDKVIDLVTNFEEDPLNTKELISTFFDFDERQGDYYANAAIYLGFVKRDDDRRNTFELTPLGETLRHYNNRNQRNLLLLKQILAKPTFNTLIHELIRLDCNLDRLSIAHMADVIEANTTLSGDTLRRRASTVKRWLQWICENIELQT